MPFLRGTETAVNVSARTDKRVFYAENSLQKCIFLYQYDAVVRILLRERPGFLEKVRVPVVRDWKIRAEKDFCAVVHERDEFSERFSADTGCVTEYVFVRVHKLCRLTHGV